MLKVLLSLGAGGLLAEGGKFIFEKSIPELQRKKVTKKAKNKYSFDLAKLSMILHHEFNDLLSWIDAGGTRFDIHIGSGYDHQRLLILYHFGNFFAWCTVIDKEAFIQYSEQNKFAEEYQKMKHRPIFKIEFDFYYEDIMGSL